MTQREILQAIHATLADEDLAQALNERLHDAAATLFPDKPPTELSHAQLVEAAAFAIEGCPP